VGGVVGAACGAESVGAAAGVDAADESAESTGLAAWNIRVNSPALSASVDAVGDGVTGVEGAGGVSDGRGAWNIRVNSPSGSGGAASGAAGAGDTSPSGSDAGSAGAGGSCARKAAVNSPIPAEGAV